jgi:hypothetical protein
LAFFLARAGGLVPDICQLSHFDGGFFVPLDVDWNRDNEIVFVIIPNEPFHGPVATFVALEGALDDPLIFMSWSDMFAPAEQGGDVPLHLTLRKGLKQAASQNRKARP